MTTMLARYLGQGVQARNPMDDKWWGGGNSVVMDPGASVDREAAAKVSTVFRAINVAAAAVAVLPVNVFRRKGRSITPAEDAPFRTQLRLQPNKIQTSFDWRHHLVATRLLTGNYYAHKYGFDYLPPDQWQLRPLDPARMEIPGINPDGSLVYRYTTNTGRQETLTADQVVHSRGMSFDGYRGLNVLELMREHLQLAASNRQSRTAFMRNAMRPSVLIKFPAGKEIDPKAETNLIQGFMRATTGGKTGRPVVLGDGGEITPFGFNSRDAQYIESEQFLVEEFLRYTGVPGVLVGYPDKTATYASAEAFFQSFVTYCVQPITESLEQTLTVSLYGVQDELRVKFNLNALLRADSQARSSFYNTLVSMGIFTRNEVRELENKNPIDGLDEPLTPKNMGGADPGGAPPAGPATPAPAKGNAPPPRRPHDPPPDDEEARAGRAALARAEEIVTSSALRVVRSEVGAILGSGDKLGAAARYAKNPDGWQAWVREFYAPGGPHADVVATRLAIPAAVADRYCAAQAEELLARGLDVVAGWEAARVLYLVELALGIKPSAAGVTVHVHSHVALPEQAAPIVQATVAAPAVFSRTDVHVPQGPAPVAHFHAAPAPEPKGPQEVHIVSLPERVTSVEPRDRDGRVKQTRERDA